MSKKRIRIICGARIHNPEPKNKQDAMKTVLPHIGRPCGSGVSIKLVGNNEYQKMWQKIHHARKTSRRWWTGLSPKQLGETVYMRLYRLKKAHKDIVDRNL